MVDADWTAIKTEYITTNISYRDLAKKYGVTNGSLYRRARAEKWVELREKSRSRVAAKSIQNCERSAEKYRDVLYALALKMARKMDDLVSEDSGIKELAAFGIKPRDITGAIKDLEDVLHVKSDADLREQEARIDNLRRQAEQDGAGGEIEVVMEGDAKKYSD